MSEATILYANADGSSMQQNLADIELAKQMSVVLQRHYPNHSWGVNVDGQAGIATIKNFSLSGDWGFLLHLVGTYSASEYDKRVMMAAGELLERYNLSRGEALCHELQDLARDRFGSARILT